MKLTASTCGLLLAAMARINIECSRRTDRWNLPQRGNAPARTMINPARAGYELLQIMQQLIGDAMHPPPEIPQRIMRQWCRGCGREAFLHGDYCLECWDGATSEDVRITMARIHNRMEKS